MRKKKVRKEKVCILGICAALAVVFCAAPTIQATEYYISPTGNDAGSGTLFDPWQSPSRVAAFRANGLHSAGATTIAIRDR